LLEASDSDALTKFHKQIEAELKKVANTTFSLQSDKLKEKLANLDDLTVSIHERAMTFYFNSVEIANSEVAEIMEITVPYTKLAPLLNEKLAKKLEIKVEKEEDTKEKLAKEKKKKQQGSASKKQAQKKDGKKKKKPAKKKSKKTSKEKQEANSNKKYVALTFDDGPSEDFTPLILEALHEYEAVATFFMLGSQAAYYPKLAKEVADRGHEIANHTQSHADLTKLSKKKVQEEIAVSRHKIAEATGVDPTLLRPPYGAFNERTLQVTGEQKETIVLWSVDSLDWKSKDGKTVKKNILNTMQNGSIILMHDIHQSTADALPGLLKKLSEQGYTFVTVSELMELQEHDQAVPVYGH